MKQKRIDKPEWIYLLVALAVTLILVLLFTNITVQTKVDALNPVIQFLIFNIGVYLVFFFVIKGFALKSRKVWVGALGTIMGFMAFDLILPEYHITSTSLITGGVLGASASDYFFGYIYHLAGVPFNFTVFGLTIPLLAILVYAITFVALFIGASYLIKNFVKKI